MLRSIIHTWILRRLVIAGLLASSSLICMSAQTATSKAQSVLSDVQAQSLIQMMSQQNGAAALTPQQSQLLLQYLLSKNGSSSATSLVGAAQTQMMLLSLTSRAQGLAGNGFMSGANARGQTPPVSVPNAVAPAAAPTLGVKKPGVVRIGIAMPKVQLAQTQGPSAGDPLRVMLIQYLTGPSVESTPIAALLPDQVEAEAKAKQCDYIVYSSLSQKKATGGMSFLKNAPGLTSMIPIVGMASTMGKVMGASAAATAESQTASLSSGIKAKTDVVLEYHMDAIGNASSVVNNTLDTKATADGQDVITPMVEKEATAIMAEVSKKK